MRHDAFPVQTPSRPSPCAGRTTSYLGPAEIQPGPDRFLGYYNEQQSHQTYRLNRRTPAHALMAALNITRLPKFMEEESTPETLVSNEAA